MNWPAATVIVVEDDGSGGSSCPTECRIKAPKNTIWIVENRSNTTIQWTVKATDAWGNASTKECRINIKRPIYYDDDSDD